MEDEYVKREKKILSILEQEIEDGEEMADAVRHIAERLLLGEKGYASSDIRTNVVFEVKLADEKAKSSVDFVVTLDSRAGMLIKCAPGSLDSRERHIVAAARVFDVLPVPVAVVMDPLSAVVLDTATGKVTGEGFDAIPTKEQLGVLLAKSESRPVAPEKLEREKRVLLAFDAIRCCIPRGGQGGMAI